VGGILRAMGWEATTERPRGGGLPVQVFLDPDGEALNFGT